MRVPVAFVKASAVYGGEPRAQAPRRSTYIGMSTKGGRPASLVRQHVLVIKNGTSTNYECAFGSCNRVRMLADTPTQNRHEGPSRLCVALRQDSPLLQLRRALMCCLVDAQGGNRPAIEELAAAAERAREQRAVRCRRGAPKRRRVRLHMMTWRDVA